MVKVKKEWTPNGYLFAAFRRVFRWSPERKACLNEAMEGAKFRCAKCLRLFERKSVAVDHKEPVVDPNKGFEGWDIYVKRLFVGRGDMQVLCKKDHGIKTKAENKVRRQCKSMKSANG